MAVEGSRDARRLLAGTIYLLAVEGSDLHYAHKCARDFIKDDNKCDRRTVSPDLPAAKNGVEEGMRKCEESNHSCMTVFECVVPFVGAADEEVWLTVDAAHGAVASFDETGREAGHVGELMRIRGEGCGCVRGRGAVQHCEAIFHRAEEHRRGRARRCTGAEGKGGGDEWAGGRVRCGRQHYAR
ncbi:hypothetical protein ERJ75_000864400 [Trypanosoma vivax]|nr:hypothetical protein ERJ75_000864400 [Trypanosoma vivax]